MLVYSETTKTKSGELRITRPIGALLISTDEVIEALANETISVFIEKANGSNIDIATNIPLRDFILSSVFGTASFDGTAGISAMCEIANDGAIALGQNESIKVKLDNLKSAKTYTIHGIELPELTNEIVHFDRKTVLTEETSRQFDVTGADEAVITGIDNVDEMHVTYLNGNTVKYLQAEIKAIASDVDSILGSGPLGVVVTSISDVVVFPVVGVAKIDIYKSAGTITVTLRDENIVI